MKQKVSSGGKYVSVNIGPVQVISSEQVLSLSLSLWGDGEHSVVLLRLCRKCYIICFDVHQKNSL